MDRNGPTAVFKSVAKLQTDKITGGVLLNQKVTPQLLSKEEDRMKMIALLRTFFNILSKQTQDDIIARTEQTL